MNTDHSHRETCRHCGDALSVHHLDGLCSRCVARISLLDPDVGSRKSAGGTPFQDSDSSLITDHSSLPRAVFGDYELLDEIARGGMGVVYRARQVSLDRVVAVKMLLLGQFASPSVFQRFRAEAAAAAKLQHPNIVAIHDIGEQNGQPFFSMDYVAGRNLAELVRERPLPARAAAQYLARIARAVHYAHDHGILHRDLKPANILIDDSDEPRITDFGLAKQLTSDSSLPTDTSSLTLSGQILGSPNFLPPEQAGGHTRAIGPACDIYGLGAVLYYLLTARPPFVAETFESTLFHVLNSDPVPPCQLNPSVSRDLETICLKCLDKDPARRYATADELADELDRFLNGEPIRARPIGPAGKAWRWCRRMPALAGALAAIAALLLTVTAISVVSAWRIATARKGEQREAYYSNIALANQFIEQGSIDRALETLWKCPPQYRHWEWGHLLYLCHQDAASFQAHATNVTATFFSPDSRCVVSQDAAGVAKVWDWEAEEQVFAFGSSSNRAGWIAFHPNGSQLAAAMGTNGVWIWATTGWQTRTNRPLGLAVPSEPSGTGAVRTSLSAQPLTRSSTTLSPPDGERAGVRGPSAVGQDPEPLLTLRPQGPEVMTLAYSGDGERLVTGGADGAVAIWDSGTGRQLSTLQTTNSPIRRVAISPDGQRLVAVAERVAWVWELQSGKVVRRFPDDSVRSTNRIAAVFADDTGRNFATIDSEDRLTLWREGRAPHTLITIRGSHPQIGRQAFFSPDGRWLANAGDENTARVWDAATGAEYLAISERVHEVSFSRDGDRMLTRGAERWLTSWDLTEGRKMRIIRGHSAIAHAGGLSLDGRLVVSADESGRIKVWNAGPGRELAQDRAWQWACAFSPDGRMIANCSSHDGVILRSVRSGRELLRIRSPHDCILDAAFSPDSRRLVTVGSLKIAKVWDVESGKLLLRLRGHRRQTHCGVAWSPDGRWVAAGSLDGTAKVWDAHTGEERLTLFMDPQKRYALTGLSNRVGRLAFDARSEQLLTGSADGKARIWQVGSGKLLATLAVGELNFSPCVRFLPDPRHIISPAAGRIAVWDVAAGRPVTQAKAGEHNDFTVVTLDGRRLITVGRELGGASPARSHGTLEIWDIEKTPRRLLELPGRGTFTGLALSPDNRTIACCSLDYRVYRWETFPWREEEYPEVRREKSEVRGQRSGIRSQAGFAERVRQYARRYWRERLDWELNGAEGEPTEPRVVEAPIDRTLFAKRDPRATLRQIDLMDGYTGELGETFHGKIGMTTDHDDDLSELPVGLVKLGGVEFDVRGVIQLRRSEPLSGPWALVAADDPVRVDGIPIQQQAARLHLLLGTAWSEADGTVIGRLLCHYADGETRSLDIVYGRDVRDWWYDPAKGDAETTDRAQVVWTGLNPVAHEYGRRLRLYLNTRDNPRPGIKITTFDFVSTMTESAPFLIAVTLE